MSDGTTHPHTILAHRVSEVLDKHLGVALEGQSMRNEAVADKPGAIVDNAQQARACFWALKDAGNGALGEDIRGWRCSSAYIEVSGLHSPPIVCVPSGVDELIEPGALVASNLDCELFADHELPVFKSPVSTTPESVHQDLGTRACRLEH